MIPHHQGAIRISEELLRYTTCIALQNIATEIVVTQTKETEEMRKMLCGCAGYRNDGQSLCGYRRQYGIIVTNMFSRMRSACPDNDINISYIRQMIPHHVEIQHLSSVKSNTKRSCQSSGKRYWGDEKTAFVQGVTDCKGRSDKNFRRHLKYRRELCYLNMKFNFFTFVSCEKVITLYINRTFL